ncbi:proprotein convertase P-domain-containing protein [Luminiphilus sp.]|nr:proprotein convertase P-domain-containing protein [Luminiphilus sp.]
MKLFKTARRLAATMCSLVFFTSSALAAGGIDILIEGNESLQSLTGLKGVIAVNSLAIKSNSALTNLDALKNLEEVVGALAVETNTVLSRCEALAPVLGWPDGQNQGVGSATISGNATGCQTEQELLGSVFGPSVPVITDQSFSIPDGASGDTVIDMALAFNPAIEQEPLFPVYGHRAICNSSQSNNEAVARPLLDFTPVSRTLEMPGSAAGGDDSAFVAQIAVDINITHSDPVDLVVALKNPEGIPLVLWDRRSPNSEDLIGAFPGTFTPEEPLNGLARERMGGTWTLSVEDVGQGPIIREGTLNSWGLRISEESVTDKVDAATSPITIKGIGHSVDYMCTLTALSRLGATPVSAVYLTPTIPRLPTQPTIRNTDYDDGEIILYALVSGDAGAAITRYDAVCTDGIATFSGSSISSRIRVAGLTNGVAYTCKVTATNAVGSSPVSLATSPITPMELEQLGGLPVWLLYQATQ